MSLKRILDEGWRGRLGSVVYSDRTNQLSVLLGGPSGGEVRRGGQLRGGEPPGEEVATEVGESAPLGPGHGTPPATLLAPNKRVDEEGSRHCCARSSHRLTDSNPVGVATPQTYPHSSSLLPIITLVSYPRLSVIPSPYYPYCIPLSTH
jgi:hypothetical protein